MFTPLSAPQTNEILILWKVINFKENKILAAEGKSGEDSIYLDFLNFFQKFVLKLRNSCVVDGLVFTLLNQKPVNSLRL